MKRIYLHGALLLACSMSMSSQTNPYRTTLSDKDGTFGNAAIGHGNRHLIAGTYEYTKGLLCMLSDSATVLWAKQYTGGNVDFADLRSVPNRFIAVCGVAGGHGFLAKLNDAGDTLWCRKLAVPGFTLSPQRIALAEDSALVVVGSAVSGTGQRGFVMKIGKTGTLLWSRTLKITQEKLTLSGVKVGADSSLFFVGTKAVGTAGANVITGRMSPAGALMYAKSAGAGTGQDLVVDDSTVTVFLQRQNPILFSATLNGSLTKAREYSCGGAPVKERSLVPADSGGFLFGWDLWARAIKVDQYLDSAWNSGVCLGEDSHVYRTTGGMWIMGDGPMYGIRSASSLGDQIGIVQISTAFSASVPVQNVNLSLAAQTLAADTAGELSGLPLAAQNMTIFSRRGCVDMVGDGVGEMSPEGQLLVWPVPAGDRLHVETPVTRAARSLVLYDVTGKAVLCLSPAGEGTVDLDCSSLTPGVYSLHYSSDGITISRKVVVMR